MWKRQGKARVRLPCSCFAVSHGQTPENPILDNDPRFRLASSTCPTTLGWPLTPSKPCSLIHGVRRMLPPKAQPLPARHTCCSPQWPSWAFYCLGAKVIHPVCKALCSRIEEGLWKPAPGKPELPRVQPGGPQRQEHSGQPPRDGETEAGFVQGQAEG